MALYKHCSLESIDNFALLSQTSYGDLFSIQHLLHQIRNLSNSGFLAVAVRQFLLDWSNYGGDPCVQILAQWTNKYGSIFKWNIAGQDMLVITDPEEVSKLCSRDLNLPKSAPFYKGLNHVSPRHEYVSCAQEQLIDTHI